MMVTRDKQLAERCEFLRIPESAQRAGHKAGYRRAVRNWVVHGNLRSLGLRKKQH